MELNDQTLRQILIEQREEYQRYFVVMTEDLSTRLKEEYQRYAGVIAEGFRADVKLVAEGQALLSEKLDATRAEFRESLNALGVDLGGAIREHSEILREHSEILREHSKILREHAEILKSVQEQLVALHTLVAKNTEDFEMMKTDIEIMKAELSVIRRDLKEKAGRDELAILEARIAKLEWSQRSRS